VRPTLKGDTRRRPMVLPPLLKVVLGNSVLTGAPRRRPRSASLSKASMTTRGPFNRILHDSECRWGADGLAGGEGVPAGAQAPVEQMRALAFRVDGSGTFVLDSGATNTQRECDSLAPWGRHDGVLATQDQSVVVVSGRGDHNRWSCQPQKCRNRNVYCERIYRHERHRQSLLR
jgi:hypothetical protein